MHNGAFVSYGRECPGLDLAWRPGFSTVVTSSFKLLSLLPEVDWESLPVK